MRAAAPVQVELRRFGIWRGAIAALTLAGVASLTAWLLALGSKASIGVAVAAMIAFVATAGMTLMGWHIGRIAPARLRWDGSAWQLGPIAEQAGTEPESGQLGVAIDLGAWMLLHFTPDTPRRAFAATWLPVQRRGLEADWHALRCAVYSPRPPPRPLGQADP